MKAIHIQTTIHSETLYLPELKPLIGHTVEIIVLETGSTERTEKGPNEWLPSFWETISRGWQGEPLVRPDQGSADTRDPLR